MNLSLDERHDGSFTVTAEVRYRSRAMQFCGRTLDGALHDLFTRWYPAMPANDGQATPHAAAA